VEAKVDLPSDQRHLLQVIFDRFHETGDWPLEADLRYELDQADDGLDIPDVARRLVPGYAYVQSGEIPATLTIHGVAASTGSEGELQDLLAVTQYAYRRYRDGHGKGRFTDADLATDMGMDELQVRRVQKLLGGLPWDGGGGGDAGGGSWYRIVGSDIVLFKRVQTVAELMAAIPLPQRLDPIATREARAAHAAGLLDAPVRPAPESSRRYPYDVALSFAGEQRPYLEQVAAGLKSHGVKVFYDSYERVTLWGKDLYTHLDDVYQNQARFVVLFGSAEYASKVWTKHELRSAQARALNEKGEYILPARFDDTKIPGGPIHSRLHRPPPGFP
jgi:hypothetical protein